MRPLSPPCYLVTWPQQCTHVPRDKRPSRLRRCRRPKRARSAAVWGYIGSHRRLPQSAATLLRGELPCSTLHGKHGLSYGNALLDAGIAASRVTPACNRLAAAVRTPEPKLLLLKQAEAASYSRPRPPRYRQVLYRLTRRRAVPACSQPSAKRTALTRTAARGPTIRRPARRVTPAFTQSVQPSAVAVRFPQRRRLPLKRAELASRQRTRVVFRLCVTPVACRRRVSRRYAGLYMPANHLRAHVWVHAMLDFHLSANCLRLLAIRPSVQAWRSSVPRELCAAPLSRPSVRFRRHFARS
jgi:hypothetical protein